MKHYYLITQGDYGSIYEAWEIEQLSKPIINFWLGEKDWVGHSHETNEPLYDGCQDCHVEYVVELEDYVEDTNGSDTPFILANLNYDQGVYSIDGSKPIERSSHRGVKVWTCVTYLGTDDEWVGRMNEILGYGSKGAL